jgi:Tol biopolymer transport system component
MQRQSLFVLLALLITLTLVACGGGNDSSGDTVTDPPPASGSTESNEEITDSNNGSSEPQTSDEDTPTNETTPDEDTTGSVSGYNGILVIQSGLSDIYRWDLATGESAVFAQSNPDSDQLILNVGATASHDGNVIAYVRNIPFQLEQTYIYDATTGSETMIPSEEGESTRFSTQPAPSTIGTVVFVHQLHTINPENSFDIQSGFTDIALWDGNEVRLLTDDEAGDTNPTISADGQTVIFISNRDRSDGDFYKIDLSGDGTPTRLSIENDPAIASIKSSIPMTYRLTADGSKILFFAQLQDGGEAPYVMDTNSGELTRLGMPEGVQALNFDMSGDGSLIAFTGLNSADPLSSPVYVIRTTSPDTVETVGEQGSYGGVTVSPDGSALAAILTDFTNSEMPFRVVVMRPDGSDQQTVSNDESIVSMFSTGRNFFRSE